MNSSLKDPTLIGGDDDDFEEVKMVKVLAGKRKVMDVFDVEKKCNLRMEGKGKRGVKLEKQIKLKLKSEN